MDVDVRGVPGLECVLGPVDVTSGLPQQTRAQPVLGPDDDNSVVRVTLKSHFHP